MSTNVFIWIKHGTHRWFEQIRFPNFQNYPPIFRPRIGLYRENAIAIESEARDPFGGNVYYVTMQIALLTSKYPAVCYALYTLFTLSKLAFQASFS